MRSIGDGAQKRSPYSAYMNPSESVCNCKKEVDTAVQAVSKSLQEEAYLEHIQGELGTKTDAQRFIDQVERSLIMRKEKKSF